ncbi:MAG: DUF72 domain-containing protein, partial [Chitinophagaceae bacterium]
MENYFSGSSGIVSKTARILYPPEFRNKSRLHYYSTLFNSVEINQTFYKLPKRSTIDNWMEDVNPGFRFTFKMPKQVSHSPQLNYEKDELKRFIDVISGIRNSGCILIQLPSGTTSEALPQLISMLKDTNDFSKNHWNIAVEFRHNSWYENSVIDYLKKQNVAVVIHDYAKGKTPEDIVTADFIYLRFHGPEPRYRGSYSDNFLSGIAQQIQNWNAQGKTVYAYFNNTM